jgi:hypothetical protein
MRATSSFVLLGGCSIYGLRVPNCPISSNRRTKGKTRYVDLGSFIGGPSIEQLSEGENIVLGRFAQGEILISLARYISRCFVGL